MKQYEFIMKCDVIKSCLVEAKDENEAIKKMDDWLTIDEKEIELFDWEIESGPKEI